MILLLEQQKLRNLAILVVLSEFVQRIRNMNNLVFTKA